MDWKRFGIVLIDKPPILKASDALLLAGIADSVLLADCARSADRNNVRRVTEQLDQTATPGRRAEPIHGRPSQPYRGYYATSENERWNGTCDEAETPQ